MLSHEKQEIPTLKSTDSIFLFSQKNASAFNALGGEAQALRVILEKAIAKKALSNGNRIWERDL